MSETQYCRARWKMFIFMPILSALVTTVCLAIVGVLLRNKSTCMWDCYGPPGTCQQGALPFCPEESLSQCELYFMRVADSSPCPLGPVRECPTCTLYFVSDAAMELSLPFYGFFISEVHLNNITVAVLGNQTVNIRLGRQEHVFSNSDKSVILRNEDFVFDLKLIFEFGIPYNYAFTIVFIGELSVTPRPMSFLVTGLVLFAATAVLLVLIARVYSCLRKRRSGLVPLDQAPLKGVLIS